jgi:hypothetical protein
MADTVGMADIRGLNVSKIVTGFALQEYKMKQLCVIESSSSWQERYFQETSTELTGGTGSAVKGVPRGATFPHGQPSWTQQNSYMLKHGMEGHVYWEDAKANDIDTVRRTLLRISRAVAKSVDDDIWDVITEGQSASNINSVSVTHEWDDHTNATPIDNILEAMRAISEQNYNPYKNGYLLVNAESFQHLLAHLIETEGSNIPQFSSEKVTNGQVGKLLGLTVVVSETVTDDYAAVVVAKEAATWKQVQPLTVRTIEEPGVRYTIRAWEIGVCQLKNPKAVTLLDNVGPS